MEEQLKSSCCRKKGLHPARPTRGRAGTAMAHSSRAPTPARAPKHRSLADFKPSEVCEETVKSSYVSGTRWSFCSLLSKPSILSLYSLMRAGVLSANHSAQPRTRQTAKTSYDKMQGLARLFCVVLVASRGCLERRGEGGDGAGQVVADEERDHADHCQAAASALQGRL